jgi:hypothetical protein
MVSVSGGEIYCIDTESDRATHYADDFKFRHVSFSAPHSPPDYAEALKHCVEQKAGVIIIDSLSHEHEGEGGVLEWHDAELERMAGNDWKKRERVKFAGWIKPKQARAKLIRYMVGCGATIISCFRSKPKLQIRKGKDPVELGFQPIGGDEFVYEQTVQCLLYPSGGGVPIWQPEFHGEKQTTKLPRQFERIFAAQGPLSEDIGVQLAKWAMGDAKPEQVPETPPDVSRVDGDTTEDDLTEILRLIDEAPSEKALQALATKHCKRPWTQEHRKAIKQAIATRAKEVE